MNGRTQSISLLLVTLWLFSGCVPLALTAAGIGGATAVNHALGGVTYKTFTAPLPKVKTASMGALKIMGIKVSAVVHQEGNEVVTAAANDRKIEIVLEPISASTTRMRVVARNGSVFYDSATATEIILQTERRLGST
jgi:hypothetical protein